MTLVVDANVAIWACGAGGSFERFDGQALVAPALMWSEFLSAVHEAVWRREVTRAMARIALDALERSPIREKGHAKLRAEAWKIADDLGMAKTYDTEYLALARLLGARCVTLDKRLRRAADRLGLVVAPQEL